MFPSHIGLCEPSPVGNDRQTDPPRHRRHHGGKRAVATDGGRVYESIIEHRDRTKYVCTYNIYIYIMIYTYII